MAGCEFDDAYKMEDGGAYRITLQTTVGELTDRATAGQSGSISLAPKKRHRLTQGAQRNNKIFGEQSEALLAKVLSKVDGNDRHVVSAAISLRRASENKRDKVFIVTSKDVQMAKSPLMKFGISVIGPASRHPAGLHGARLMVKAMSARWQWQPAPEND